MVFKKIKFDLSDTKYDSHGHLLNTYRQKCQERGEIFWFDLTGSVRDDIETYELGFDEGPKREDESAGLCFVYPCSIVIAHYPFPGNEEKVSRFIEEFEHFLDDENIKHESESLSTK